ncbi:uncharacterized protein LOC135492797 [Lineus longissimus]|uniref:uncharacterized protein LOC135492797 n=1 Tax=Lineus longissimus TaxID=88925 RepID=UPI002B4F2C86
MGCGGSKDQTTPENTGSKNRKPKVSILVENKVTLLEGKPKVVFIFGGPGSKKGRIVDDLVSSYGFHYLSSDNIVLEELPKKVKNVVEISSTKDLQECLKDDSSRVSLRWVLETMRSQMEREKGDAYLIDLVPNLRFLLKIQNLIKDGEEELEIFEQQYPISFALNLTVKKDHVIKNVEVHRAKTGKDQKESGQSDEADSSRTQKRLNLFEESASSFMEYFMNSQRLVTVDVSCGVPDLIWARVSEFFAEMRLLPVKTVNTVIVFSFNESDFKRLDMQRYCMNLIVLRDIVEDPFDSVPKLLQILCDAIDKSPANIESFAVNLSGTSVEKLVDNCTNNKHSIIFVDETERFLDNFIYVTAKKPVRRISLFSLQYKTISSTENEVCLFPMETNIELCRHIAVTMAEMRHSPK